MCRVLQTQLHFLAHVFLRNLDVLCCVSKRGAQSVVVHWEFDPFAIAYTNHQFVVFGQCAFGVVDGLLDGDVCAVYVGQVNFRADEISYASLVCLGSAAVPVVVSANDCAITAVTFPCNLTAFAFGLECTEAGGESLIDDVVSIGSSIAAVPTSRNDVGCGHVFATCQSENAQCGKCQCLENLFHFVCMFYCLLF